MGVFSIFKDAIHWLEVFYILQNVGEKIKGPPYEKISESYNSEKNDDHLSYEVIKTCL